MEEQTDLYRMTDMLAAYRASLRGAVQRLTPKYVASFAGITPSTLGHQMKHWNSRKHPCAVTGAVAIWKDEQHRKEVLGQVGLLVIKPPRMTPAEALREVVARGSKGFVSSQELAELLAQTDMGGGR